MEFGPSGDPQLLLLNQLPPASEKISTPPKARLSRKKEQQFFVLNTIS